MSTQDHGLQPAASDTPGRSPSGPPIGKRVEEESSREFGKSVTWTEESALSRLGIEEGQLPPGFKWSSREQAWVREVSVDPAGKVGMTPADAEQLALLVASFNTRVEFQALKARFTDPGEHPS